VLVPTTYTYILQSCGDGEGPGPRLPTERTRPRAFHKHLVQLHTIRVDHAARRLSRVRASTDDHEATRRRSVVVANRPSRGQSIYRSKFRPKLILPPHFFRSTAVGACVSSLERPRVGVAAVVLRPGCTAWAAKNAARNHHPAGWPVREPDWQRVLAAGETWQAGGLGSWPAGVLLLGRTC
jgi:hypothetical protein